jgi:hypothetical protein
MPGLGHRQQKIQAKRKQTSWKDFVKELGSWKPLTFHKIDGKLSVYAPDARVGNVVDPSEFDTLRDDLPTLEFTTDFRD